MECFNFFDVQIANTNINETKNKIENYLFTNPSYILFPDAYVIALSQKNKFLKSILNKSYLTLPDGKPSAIMGRKKGLQHIEPVSGYWLSKALLDTSLSHYFLGSTPERLKKLKNRIELNFPKANVLGYTAPRFVTENEVKFGVVLKEEFKKINALKPDLIWIGISSPKQDYIMHHHLPLLKHGLMLGVGGVFDYLSGDVKKSPEWIKRIGMRWAWRLGKEPKRMWGKYFFVFKTLSWKYLVEYMKG